jgi:hypothetical protein
VTYTFPFVEWVTNNPLTNRTIQVCNKLEPACMPPLQAVTNIVEGQRNVSVQIPAGQNVFLILGATGVLPEILNFDGPLYADQTGGRIQMLRPETVGGLAQQLQIPLVQELGVLAIRPHDCNGAIVPGAVYSIDNGGGTSIPYTFDNGRPTAAVPPVPATTTLRASDTTPWSGFVNVPPGLHTVFGLLGDESGTEFGSASVYVQPGVLNIIEVRALNHL